MNKEARGVEAIRAMWLRTGVFRGVDFNLLARRLWALPAMRADGRKVPRIRWRAYTMRGGAWGTAFVNPRNLRVTMRVHVAATLEDVCGALLHELVHCSCPPRAHHGELFCRRLIACFCEAWRTVYGLEDEPLLVDVSEMLALAPKNGKRAYAIDAALQELTVRAGLGGKLPTSSPTLVDLVLKTEEVLAIRRETHAAARESRVAARENHARAMLATWQKRASSAKRRVAKWGAKVRYYDRKREAATRPTKP